MRDTEYSAIIMPAGSFLLLHKRADSIKALQNLHKHLCAGGRFIVDLSIQTDISTGAVSTRIWSCVNGDIITLESKIVEIDYINQYTISHSRYEKWREGVLVQTELEYFRYGGTEWKNSNYYLKAQDLGYSNFFSLQIWAVSIKC